MTKSPNNSRPQSPRRVEFADEVFFNFNGTGNHVYQRSASSDINPASQAKANKPILRNVNSDAGLLSPGKNNPSKRPMSLIEQYHEMSTASTHNLPEPLAPLVIEHTNLDCKRQIFHEFFCSFWRPSHRRMKVFLSIIQGLKVNPFLQISLSTLSMQIVSFHVGVAVI